MILYATSETILALELKTFNELSGPRAVMAQYIQRKEAGNPLYEWGCNYFFFLGKTTLQLTNAASGLTVYLINIDPNDLSDIGTLTADMVASIYDGDPEFRPVITKYFADHGNFCFDRLTNKLLLKRVNDTMLDSTDTKNNSAFLANGVLRTRALNKIYNEKRLPSFSKNPSLKGMSAADAFKSLVLEEYL